MRQIKWGIIGCGNVTERKSGPAFNKVDGSMIVAVMRRNADKAAEYARRHGISEFYSDAESIINHPEINAIYVATPPSSHAQYAIECMKKGKAVYVEKPMASDYESCRKMTEMSDITGQPLYVAYYRRFLPYFIRVKEILDKGFLGKLLYGKIDFHISPRTEDFMSDNLPWRIIPEIAGAGYFYDLACHQLDILDWYFGDAHEIKASTFNQRGLYQPEDLVFATVKYKDIPVIANWCFASANNEHKDTIILHGSEGSLEFSTFDFTPIKLTTSAGTEEFLPDNPENIQYYYIRNMVEELQNLRPLAPNGKTAMRINHVMDIILDKLKS